MILPSKPLTVARVDAIPKWLKRKAIVPAHCHNFVSKAFAALFEAPKPESMSPHRFKLLICAGGLVLAGVTIMFVGMTFVFVPQDLAFMRLSAEKMLSISPRLAPGTVWFGAALGVHFAIGYLDLLHLAPAYQGAGIFLLGVFFGWARCGTPAATLS